MAASVNDALDQPVNECLEILENRHYVKTLQQVRSSKLSDLNPNDPMVTLALENIAMQGQVAKARRAAKL